MDKILYSAIVSVLMANSVNSYIASNSGIDKMFKDLKGGLVMSNENSVKIDKAALQDCIDYLQTRPKVVRNPYPNYDARVMKAFDLLEPDYDYSQHLENLGNTPIGEMNIENIRTMLTFINRGERFCDGHIAGFVDSGLLLKILNRLSELTK